MSHPNKFQTVEFIDKIEIIVLDELKMMKASPLYGYRSKVCQLLRKFLLIKKAINTYDNEVSDNGEKFFKLLEKNTDNFKLSERDRKNKARMRKNVKKKKI